METDRQALSSAVVTGEAGCLVESQREIFLCLNAAVPLTTTASVVSARPVGSVSVGFSAHSLASGYPL